jgi:hypothetical protein
MIDKGVRSSLVNFICIASFLQKHQKRFTLSPICIHSGKKNRPKNLMRQSLKGDHRPKNQTYLVSDIALIYSYICCLNTYTIPNVYSIPPRGANVECDI